GAPPTFGDRPRSRGRSAPGSTSPRTALRGSRCGTPDDPCRSVAPDPDRKSGTHPTPPNRPAQPARRTRTYRTDRAQWCARASHAQSSRLWIEPGRRGQSLSQIAPNRPVRPDPAHQKVAIVVDHTSGLRLARQPAQELACDDVKAIDLPGIVGKHQMPRKA